MSIEPRIQFISESALLLEWKSIPSPKINREILALHTYIHQHPFQGYIEGVPGYVTLTIHFQPFEMEQVDSFSYVKHHVLTKLHQIQQLIQHDQTPKVIPIPVCYSSSFGPDLEFVSSFHNRRKEDIVSIHSQTDYPVYFLGFAPGFPFLGGMDERIATPRKNSPRQQVPAGSVGIAGNQTGVYPLSTPGGWQIIGRTPIPLVTSDEQNPTLIKPGDIVRFQPITEKEFVELEGSL
ncbi:5-oxoprolinase subunit PxpB [Radiobacillus deserti]|nr:5-oxoprolinase subunit PxpB [Radiobacillus deserti]